MTIDDNITGNDSKGGSASIDVNVGKDVTISKGVN